MNHTLSCFLFLAAARNSALFEDWHAYHNKVSAPQDRQFRAPFLNLPHSNNNKKQWLRERRGSPGTGRFIVRSVISFILRSFPGVSLFCIPFKWKVLNPQHYLLYPAPDAVFEVIAFQNRSLLNCVVIPGTRARLTTGGALVCQAGAMQTKCMFGSFLSRYNNTDSIFNANFTEISYISREKRMAMRPSSAFPALDVLGQLCDWLAKASWAGLISLQSELVKFSAYPFYSSKGLKGESAGKHRSASAYRSVAQQQSSTLANCHKRHCLT